MRQNYPLLEIYQWCKRQLHPFSAYMLENQFNIYRNGAKRWLTNEVVFNQVPMSGGITYFSLKIGVTVDEFLAAVDGRLPPVAKELDTVIRNSFGEFDLRKPPLPLDTKEVWRYVANNFEPIGVLFNVSQTPSHSLSDEQMHQLIKAMGEAYPVLSVLMQLTQRALSDPRLSEPNLLRSVLLGD